MEGPTLGEKIQLTKTRVFAGKLWPFMKWVLIIALGVGLGNSLVTPMFDPAADDESEDSAFSDAGDTYEGCSVAGVELRGTLLTYISEHAEGDTYFDYDVTASEDIMWLIEEANRDDGVKAIVLEVDSGGGSPVAGE